MVDVTWSEVAHEDAAGIWHAVHHVGIWALKPRLVLVYYCSGDTTLAEGKRWHPSRHPVSCRRCLTTTTSPASAALAPLAEDNE